MEIFETIFSTLFLKSDKSMTTHEMRLHSRPFGRIKEGRQVIESRLNDEKRQQIEVGDHVVFALRPDFVEKVEAEVTEIIHAPTFRELFLSHPLTEFGIEDGNIGQVEKMYISTTPKRTSKNMEWSGLK